MTECRRSLTTNSSRSTVTTCSPSGVVDENAATRFLRLLALRVCLDRRPVDVHANTHSVSAIRSVWVPPRCWQTFTSSFAYSRTSISTRPCRSVQAGTKKTPRPCLLGRFGWRRLRERDDDAALSRLTFIRPTLVAAHLHPTDSHAAIKSSTSAGSLTGASPIDTRGFATDCLWVFDPQNVRGNRAKGRPIRHSDRPVRASAVLGVVELLSKVPVRERSLVAARYACCA
jgi:hypothetical protein